MTRSTPTLNLYLDTGNLTSPTLQALAALTLAAQDTNTTSITFADNLNSPTTRLDSLITASALAPITTSIGLIPEVVSAITEPFHTATAIQTIDHASLGRAGLALRPGTDPTEHATHGRWPSRDITEDAILADADDTLEAIARLWESWQDDAVIRDTTTDRFLDRTRIHDANFVGSRFSIEGASITPRSPQGRPPVVIEVADAAEAALAARADVVVIPGLEASTAAAVRDRVDRSRWATNDVLVWGQVPLAQDTDVAGVLAAAEAADYDGVRFVPDATLYTPSALTTALAAAHAPSPEGTLRQALGLAEAQNPYVAQEASLV